MGNRRHILASCQVEKRSPFRYFEMRGKKNPRWELRGMFVGVRGKKWANAPYEDNSPFIRVLDNTERIGMDGDSPTTLGNRLADSQLVSNIFVAVLFIASFIFYAYLMAKYACSIYQVSSSLPECRERKIKFISFHTNVQKSS